MAAYVQDAIMLFGDSLTEMGSEAGGLAQILSDVYRRKLDVINRGLSGYNTRWAIPVLEQVFSTQSEQQHIPKVRLLTIWFGANDAAIPESRQHVPLSEYTANLAILIRMIKSPSSPHYSPSTRIVIITAPPVNTHQWGANRAAKEPPQDLDRHFELTKSYVDAAKEVAESESVPVCDVWTPIWKASGEVEGKLSAFMSDGLHLNEDGYKIVYDELIKTISGNFPEVHYDKLQEVFVPFFDIDDINFRTSVQKRQA